MVINRSATTLLPILKFLGLASLAIGLLVSPASAQAPIKRPADTARTLVLLARTMGEVHYLHIVCDGRKTQDWRDRMVELLELENPNYQLRARLIRSFNQGFEEQQRIFPKCVDQIEEQIQIKSKQGRILSDALADPYLR